MERSLSEREGCQARFIIIDLVSRWRRPSARCGVHQRKRARKWRSEWAVHVDLVKHQGGFGKPYCRVARNQGSLDGSEQEPSLKRCHLATGISFDHLLFEAIPGGGVAAPAVSPLHLLWGLVHWLAWSGKDTSLDLYAIGHGPIPHPPVTSRWRAWMEAC